MRVITKILATALLAAAAQAASAIEIKVNAYTANSLTFTLTGAMPTTHGTLADGPNEIDLAYTGNLWSGGTTRVANSLDARPILGSGAFLQGSTGGFGLSTDYSWFYFANDLTGLEGSGRQVTLTLASKTGLLNTLGTGTIDLYWGNLTGGTGNGSVLLSSVNIVDGKVVTSDVPEPAAPALLGLGTIALAVARRRKASRA